MFQLKYNIMKKGVITCMGLLITVDNKKIYTNSLVRYYNEDRTKIQYGLAISYDSVTNTLTVKAGVETLIDPNRVIETYTESQWKTIEINRHDGYVDVDMYPFDRNWTIVEKQGRVNNFITDMPYTRYGILDWSRYEEIGLEEFLNQLELFYTNLINTEVMEFSFNYNLKPNRTVKLHNLPLENHFEMDINSLLGYSNNSARLRNQLMFNIETVLMNDILAFSDQEVVDLDDRFHSQYDNETQEAIDKMVAKLPLISTNTISARDIANGNISKNFKNDLFDRQIKTIQDEILGALDFAKEDEDYTRISLPYQLKKIYTTSQLMNLERGKFLRDLESIGSNMIGLFNRDISTGILVDQTIKADRKRRNLILLPHTEIANVNMDKLWDHSVEYLYNHAIDTARDVILNKLIKGSKYTSSNEVIDLSYTIHSGINTLKIMNMTKVEQVSYIMSHMYTILDELSTMLKYKVVLGKDKFNTTMYIAGLALDKSTDDEVKEEIINNMEYILGKINEEYWDIKTRGETSNSVYIPLVDELEYIEKYSNSTKKVYKTYIKYNNRIYLGYVVITKSKIFNGVKFMSKNPQSNNNVTLIEAEKNIDPLEYSLDYIKFLINNKRNEVIDLIESGRVYY